MTHCPICNRYTPDSGTVPAEDECHCLPVNVKSPPAEFPQALNCAKGSELRTKIDEAVVGLWLTYRKAFSADPHILHVGDSKLFESIAFHPAIQSRLSK